MSSHDLPDYNSLYIQAISFPKAEAWGNGWWRVAWEIETTPQTLPSDLYLPPPSPEVGDLALIVAVLPREPGRITIQALSRYEKLIGEEVAYISRIMQAIRDLYQTITIDGYSQHPILRMAGG